MKLIHLTDTHLVAPGLCLYGLDPAARLAAAVADINTRNRDAALAVVTGDLTHWGEPEAYRVFKQAMDKLVIPYVAMVGNHDRRAACLEALPGAAPRDLNNFVQGTRDTSAGRLIFLDTLDEHSHAGQLCTKRFAWFDQALDEAPRDKPLFVFMHHPPFAVGVHAMDEIALVERARFAEVLKPHRGRIRHLFFGHVHRPISGTWNDIPFSTLRGTSHQVWLDLDPNGSHLASHEPPAYAVVLIGNESVVVHTHDFLDTSPRFPFSSPNGGNDRDYALGPLRPVSQG
jgi:3',5'-cyclic-AMP phosphodiesterase